MDVSVYQLNSRRLSDNTYKELLPPEGISFFRRSMSGFLRFVTVCVEEDGTQCPSSMFVDVRQYIGGAHPGFSANICIGSSYYECSVMLEGSRFELELDFAVRIANETMVPEFKDAAKPLYVKFGSTRDIDRRNGIFNGRVQIDGYVCLQFISLVVPSKTHGGRGLLGSLSLPFNHL
jgi:hypothetical protein